MSDVPSHEPPAGETERASSTRPVIQPSPDRRAATPPPGRSTRPRPDAAPQRRQGPPPTAYVPQEVYPTRRAPQRRPAAPSESGLYLPWWSLILLVGIVSVLAFGLLLLFSELSQPQTPGNQPPRVQVITSQPTLSENFTGNTGQAGQYWPTPIPMALPTATLPLPTPAPSPTLPPGEFAVGVTVSVVGVDLSGLKVRESPGYDGTLRFLAAEGNAFVIVDGPQEVDDLEWWRLEDPNDASRYGWAARNYLMVASQ